MTITFIHDTFVCRCKFVLHKEVVNYSNKNLTPDIKS